MNKVNLDLTTNELKILYSIFNEAKYGLEIIETVKKTGGIIFLGSLYNIMSRLEKRNLVESYLGEDTSERGGNRRKYFKITGKGQTAVEQAELVFMSMMSLKKNYFIHV